MADTTERALAEVLVANESLKMRVCALEQALLNIKGFYIETVDGSQQGQIKYAVIPPVQVDAEPITGVAV